MTTLPWRSSAGGSTPPDPNYVSWANLDADDAPTSSLEARVTTIEESVAAAVPAANESSLLPQSTRE